MVDKKYLDAIADLGLNPYEVIKKAQISEDLFNRIYLIQKKGCYFEMIRFFIQKWKNEF